MSEARKVLVTGGAGFIGSHTVVELCAAGYEPIIVDNFCNSDRRILSRIERIVGRPVTCRELDCADGAAMTRLFETDGRFFGVIHFAAHKAVGASVGQPLKYYRNNVGSLVTLLETMRDQAVRNLVFSSSCTVYGQPDTLPVTEATPRKTAESPYGRSKQFCEDVIDDTVRSGQVLSAVTLRYFNPVGAHPSSLIGELPIGAPENLVPYITQTAAGIREQLTVFGDDYDTPDGTCVRDYIHVVDLAKAHVSALNWLSRRNDTPNNEVLNVGTGRGTSVLQAIAAFEQAAGKKLNYRIGPRRPGDVVETYANVDKSQSTLEWKCELTTLDAMRDAYNWQASLATNPLS
ncbi:MAG: UDP-glucose 4-epimerase GalE [Pseudomonadota bacterium]|jgi:UDP-glucose 4-epimerase